MTMDKKWQSVKIPAEIWELLKVTAARSGVTIADLLRERFSEERKDKDTSSTSEQRQCLFCGSPSNYLICDHCYFDPNVIRPTSFGWLYLKWAIDQIMLDPNNVPSLDEFIECCTPEYAEANGIPDSAWNIFEEWVGWRQLFRDGKVTIDDKNWRKFVVQSNNDEAIPIRKRT